MKRFCVSIVVVTSAVLWLVPVVSAQRPVVVDVVPPLYETGNVLAVGVWNGDTGSSDLAVSAELSDNNGVIYVQDSSAEGGWPQGTLFNWYVALYDDGFGEEQPGWQQRDFDDSAWEHETDVGFTIGHGSAGAETGEIELSGDMESVYTRSIFDVQNLDSVFELTLKLAADDEAVVWLNGVFIGYTASGTSDRGESAEDYVFDTTISGGAGGLENDSVATVFTGEGTRIFIIRVKEKPWTVTRTLPTAAFIPSRTISGITLTADISAGSSVDLTITETPPAGWTVSNLNESAGTVNQDGSGNIVWTLSGASGTQTLTYDVTAPEGADIGQWSGTATDGSMSFSIDGDDLMNVMPPLYKTGNVLAVGVWNTDSGSSDLAATADLSDSNGVTYVQDSSAAGGWPQGTQFHWKVVLYADGWGEEEPGWQQRGFDDSEAKDWIHQTDVGFTIGHGGNDGENGETLLDGSNETVYTRSIFDTVDYDSITELTLKLEGDDSAVAWLNGVYIGVAGSETGDNGEYPRDYKFDTTTGGSGGVEANPSTYTQSQARTFIIKVSLIEAEPVPVSDWPIH